MARERSNFESYSMCYEHVLEHTRLKLSQTEQEKLHENQLNLIQKVCELISEEQLRDLEQENCGLAALLCKVRSLGRWRLAVQQARFQDQLSRAQKEATQSKKECVRTKLMAEQEAVLFRQQLLALRQALARAQAHNVRMCEQQESQARLLKELEHKTTQESLHRQQLDLLKTSSMERLLEDVEQKEQHLQLLAEEAERAARLGQLQRKKTERELRQMRRQLAQERSVKLDAFQRVEELQSQLNDAVSSSVLMSSPGGLISRAPYSLSSAPASSRYPQQHLLKTNLMGNKITGRIQRPKTVPTKHKRRIDDVFLPNVAENVQLSAFQVQTAPSRIPFRPNW
ncbi:coiled-coil domain-containing protein 162-like [Myotis daubentonii]|uniref:coiled-coil domain-containing protein 162-like n=1 Tax=Myotis daubentonii TaxID=98922 RepID=UPI0028734283|nr:coiled-coil domain-containing protein 162-like [Myotis daubentonii]